MYNIKYIGWAGTGLNADKCGCADIRTKPRIGKGVKRGYISADRYTFKILSVFIIYVLDAFVVIY